MRFNEIKEATVGQTIDKATDKIPGAKTAKNIGNFVKAAFKGGQASKGGVKAAVSAYDKARSSKYVDKKTVTSKKKKKKIDPATGKEKTPGKRKTPVKKESIYEGARIHHMEDLVFFQGSKGAMRAIQSLKSMESGGHQNVTIKWDGSPAVIFGRDDNGEFILTDKSGFVAKGYDGKAKSGDDLEKMLMARPGAKRDPEGFGKFASNMKTVFSYFESAVPDDYRGFFKGDLLYFDTPPIKNGKFVFKPQLVTYSVNAKSDLGKKISQSKAGVVVHREVNFDGNESPLKDFSIFKGSQLLVMPPVTATKPPQVDNDKVSQLESIVKSNSPAIDSLLDKEKLRSMQLTDFDEILYTYMNSKVDTGLQNLGKDFIKWLSGSKVSARKQAKIIDYIKQNMNAFVALWKVVTGIMQVKDSVINQLDQQDSEVSASIGDAKGGEGYVLAHPDGDMKMVGRDFFTKANRAVQR